MDKLVSVLRAAGEPTRLRILAILMAGELTVSELTQILGHSQPRISRHLKLLVDSGLLERKPEGSWVFYRIADIGKKDVNLPASQLAQFLASMVSIDDDDLRRDFDRLEAVKSARAEAAQAYFREQAHNWSNLRSLHVPDADIDSIILEMVGPNRRAHCVDLGTGTGHILELLAPHIEKGEGFDSSREMLAIARIKLDQPDYRHCQVRLGDILALPFANGRDPAGGVLNRAEPGVDLVTIHQVLHYLPNPRLAIEEAARILAPGGTMLVVDFAPHSIEALREHHAHRRLGFAEREVSAWMEGAGLEIDAVRHLSPPSDGLQRAYLTVSIWRATAREHVSNEQSKEVAL